MHTIGTPDISVTFNPDGSAALTINGETTTLRGDDTSTLRAEVVSRAAKLAQRHSQTVRLRVLEDESTTLVDVRADGSNAVVPPPQPSTTALSAAPEPTFATAGPEPVMHPRPVESQQEPEGSATPAEETTPDRQPQAPHEVQEPAPEPFAYDDHPEWQDERKRPATEGWRALLRIAPGPAELERRKQEFDARKTEEAEQARREAEQLRAEQQRAAEELSRREAREQQRTAHRAKLNRKIQTNYQGTRTILVANPKGGVENLAYHQDFIAKALIALPDVLTSQ